MESKITLPATLEYSLDRNQLILNITTPVKSVIYISEDDINVTAFKRQLVNYILDQIDKHQGEA